MDSKRGFMLVVSISAMVFLTMLGYTSLSRTANEGRLSRWSMAMYRSMALAEASVDRSFAKLHVGDFTNLSTTTWGDGTYWAEVTPAGGPLEFLVTAHGRYASAPTDLEVLARLQQTSVFQFALFGSNQVTIGGTVETDSYDATDGLYDASTAGDNGDVGTNAVTAGGVVIDGSLTMEGQLAVGPDVADPDSVVTISGGSYSISADPPIVSQSATMPMPDITVPGGLVCNNATLNGGAPTVLSSAVGVYCFHNLKLNGGATLTSDGPVQVYVTGQFYAGGNTLIGVPEMPKNFLMYVTSDQQATIEGTITGTSEFHGGLYAPNTTISIGGNAKVFGSVIAENVEVPGDAEIHYDESLGTLIEPPGFYRVKQISWREL